MAPRTGDSRLASKEIYEQVPFGFPGGDALREDFLLGIPSKHTKVFRALFAILHELYIEASETMGARNSQPFLRSELRAASRDLRHVAKALAVAAHVEIEEARTRTHDDLVQMADRLAVQLATIAAEIDARLGRKKPTP